MLLKIIRTISHSESEMLVNMVNFYGMKTEIVLMILEYCRSLKEKNKNRAIGTAYILKIAQNWMDEGIETVAQAELSAFFLISSKLYDGVPPILSSAADFFAALLFANCSFSDATSAGVEMKWC